MPLFSIVITAYNKGDFIKRTIESALNQTIQDFEIIVIDDGSTDDTKAKVAEIADERVHYVYQKASGLPACARNRGIALAQGRYIALLDGDDIWFRDKLKKTLKAFISNPDADIVCHDVNIIAEDKRLIRRTYFGPYPEDMLNKLLWEGNCAGITEATLKREIFFKHNLWFDEDVRLFAVEDYDFWMKIAKVGIFRFYYLDEVLAEHIMSDKGIAMGDPERSALNSVYLFDKYIKDLGHLSPAKSLLARKRRSSMLRSTALFCNYKKDFFKGALLFLKAIREYPLSKNNYVGLAASILGIRLNKV